FFVIDHQRRKIVTEPHLDPAIPNPTNSDIDFTVVYLLKFNGEVHKNLLCLLRYSFQRRDAAKRVLFLKLVNASSKPQALDIKLEGASGVKSNARLTSLSAKTPDETNTISEPAKIVPVQSTVKNVGAEFRHTLPPYSIHVLELDLK